MNPQLLYLIALLLPLIGGWHALTRGRGVAQRPLAYAPLQPERAGGAGCSGIAWLLIVLVVLGFGWWLITHVPLLAPSSLPSAIASSLRAGGASSLFTFSTSPGAPAEQSVLGGPDLSPTFINQVLARADSPAGALGDTLYQLSQQYHIKDSFALAVFHHESTFGRYGVAAATHSLGNIRCSPGWLSCISGYRAYATWAAGALDFYRVIAAQYLPDKRTTVETIIPKYAPIGDHNDPTSYIQAVVADMMRWQAGEN